MSDFARKRDHRESHPSRAVVDCSENGLVYTERDGRRKWVVPAAARAVDGYQHLLQ